METSYQTGHLPDDSFKSIKGFTSGSSFWAFLTHSQLHGSGLYGIETLACCVTGFISSLSLNTSGNIQYRAFCAKHLHSHTESLYKDKFRSRTPGAVVSSWLSWTSGFMKFNNQFRENMIDSEQKFATIEIMMELLQGFNDKK